MLPTTTQTEIASIDAEIFVLEKRLHDLRRRRNALQPISILPSELVSKILKHVVADVSFHNKRHAEEHELCGRKLLDWLSITQVCTHWRAVALECSWLWSHIWSMRPGKFHAFIERSKDRPLHIDTWGGESTDEEYDEMFQLLVSNMHRIQSLYLRPDCNTTRLRRLRNIPAPILEILQCSTLDNGSTGDVWDPVSPHIMPKLRELQMNPCTRGVWQIFLPSYLPTVTDITLDGLDTSNRIELLSRCPAVCSLSTTDGWAEPVILDRHLMLPHLTFLKCSYESGSLLDHISFPSVLRLEIEDDIAINNPMDAMISVTNLRKALEPFNNPTRKSARLDHLSLSYAGGKLIVSASGTKNEELLIYTIHDAALHRCTNFLDRVVHLTQNIGIGFHSISVQGAFDPRSDFRGLFHTFREQARATTISIKSLEGLVGLLAFYNSSNRTCQDRSSQVSDRPFCDCIECYDMRITSYPGLRTLVLDGVEEKHFRFCGSVWLQVLLEWLEERRDRGFGLKALILRAPSGPPVSEDLERLRRCVDEVVVETP
ncbi:hypothetical protein AX16_006316 [Volvariella volvacea WC 439]|nr:hypothetical protein AX16_006316 [Volvariella volvacea WC 439]